MNIMEDGPSMIWGVVCLLLLVSSLAARRLPLGYVAKAGLAWIAIFATLFAIFSFRFEFIGIWDRVKADISGTAGQNISSEAIELRRQDDGHYWLTVNINGKPVRFMVDSGATMTAINATTAREAGVEADGYPIILGTANGRIAAKRGVVRLLAVGPHSIENHQVVVSERFGEVNVLGMNFLNSMQSWRVEANMMVLRP
ncbi:MAG: TIGR02281 family clan AA aspartic protease [Sphingorhabdus sp.]|jgi:aspartyl protease family protein|uniref:retropepsin-like aspartic protease family protein n=1 Tax=Sphingorhabdus sp. TaxID=1902408 RepID=UPI0025DC0D68|nr:TIGR02281 family clan AA aspartic protease [Sphingorhabdus sp.]MCO4092480.1 TIGR02281 family clan AA aspartic protease [Sphingorhabdus sp.]